MPEVSQYIHRLIDEIERNCRVNHTPKDKWGSCKSCSRRITQLWLIGGGVVATNTTGIQNV